MFADPQSYTPTGGSAKSLPRIDEGHGIGQYRYTSATESVDFTIRHSDVKANGDQAARFRHNVEMIRTIYATSTTPKVIQKDYLVIERQEGDLSKVDLEGFLNWILSSGVILKLLGKEA